MIVVAIALLSAAASPTDTWTTHAQTKFDAGEYCESLFYAKRVADLTHEQEDLYAAFLAAFYADQMKLAAALYSRIVEPNLLAQLQGQKVTLDQLGATAQDTGCAEHAPVCGDFIVDGTEHCDDGNRVAGDGCTAACSLELEAETNTAASRALPESAPTQAKEDLPSPLFIGGGVAALIGLVTGATGTGVALANDGVISSRTTLGTEKEDAFVWRTAGLIGLLGGAVLVVGGAAVAAAGAL